MDDGDGDGVPNNSVQQLTGNVGQKIENKSATLPSACNNQAVVQLRWAMRDVSRTQNRPSFAVDNISVTVPVTNYTLTTAVSPTSSGTVTLNPAGGTYSSGTVVAMTANPAAHYHFVNWTGSVTGTVSPTNVTMDANKSVTANFALDQYALSVAASPTAGGTVTGGGTYDYGTSVPVTATANPNYHFVNWTGPVADPNSASTTVTVTGATSVTANFALDTYTLATAVDPALSGTVTGAGTYDYGTSAPIEALPRRSTTTSWSGPVT